jgi:hypothetical protein
MSDLTVRWSDVIDGFRREMAGDQDRERGRLAGRLLVSVAKDCLAGAYREALEDALYARLAALYPTQAETARRVVSALADLSIAESLLMDDRGLGLGNLDFEELAYPPRRTAVA